MPVPRSWVIAPALFVLPFSAHAHAFHPLWIVAALSPLVVLLLTAVLAWLARSVLVGVVHATLIIAWVALFWLASNYVTNDYVIWAPLAIYAVHSVIIVGLVLWCAFTRLRPKGSL